MSREPDLAKQAAWKLRLREFDRGSATVVEFCRSEGVSVASFYQWRQKLKPATARTAPRGRVEKRPIFLPVEITGAANVEVLLPSGVRLTVPCCDHEAIRTVLAALLSASLMDSRREDRGC